MQMEMLVGNNETNLDDEWLKFMENSINDNNLSENALDEYQNNNESKLEEKFLNVVHYISQQLQNLHI